MPRHAAISLIITLRHGHCHNANDIDITFIDIATLRHYYRHIE